MKNLLLLFAFVPIVSQSQVITTFAGSGSSTYTGDGGSAIAAGIYGPNGLEFDASGNVYISEFLGNVIRKVSSSGIITTIAGMGIPGYSGDGGAATNAKFNGPVKLFIDGAGNLLIADQFNNCIRKVSPSGIISTFAGTSTPGYTGDGIPATSAELNQPTGITGDASGNYYIADYLNNRIRKVNPAGMISTVAGNGVAGFSGDGGAATAASLYGAFGITVDGSGNLFIADHFNNRIRRVSTTGIINTIAGTGSGSFGGDGGQATSAELNYPGCIAIDGSGNLFIADELNYRVRKITAGGIIFTYVGDGYPGFYGDGGPATAAAINHSNEVKFDAGFHLYITDNSNNRVRIIVDSGCSNTITTQPLNDTVFVGDTAKFSVATSMPAPSFQWQEDRGLGFVNLANVWPYSGVYSNILIIQDASHFLNTSHYRCIITSESSPCADSTNPAILIIESGVGVSRIGNASVQIFPDPAHDELTISLLGFASQGNVQVYNEIGQQLLEQKITGSTTIIKVNEMPSGIYFLRISMGDQIIIRKEFKD